MFKRYFPSVIDQQTLWRRGKRSLSYQGRSQDFRVGGTDVCARVNLAPPTYEMESQSSNYHSDRVLIVASELESRFSTEFWDKISFWLSSKLYCYSSWWFGVAKGVLDKAVLWNMLTSQEQREVLEPPWAPPEEVGHAWPFVNRSLIKRLVQALVKAFDGNYYYFWTQHHWFTQGPLLASTPEWFLHLWNVNQKSLINILRA